MLKLAACTLFLLFPGLTAAQEAIVPFGGLKHDNSLPVEIAADSLALDQAAGTAVFDGHVQIAQGGLKLAAAHVLVHYVAGEEGATGEVERIEASGGVTLTNGSESASGATAIYTVSTGVVEMSGEVILTQGANALSAERMTIDLKAGTAALDGRVRTILRPENSP
jgi:lipopolysaccharide export system protein LptA